MSRDGTRDGSGAALRTHRGFMRLWLARLAATAGSQMLMVAVGWQMYDLTHSAWDLGLVGLAQFVPALALVLVAGHVIDRHHRGRIVALCLAVQVAVALLLGLASGSHLASRTGLLAAALVLGAVRAFQLPAQQALTPLLVPPAVLPRALAFSSAGMQGAIIAGPALGGLLYAGGAALTYASCGLLFLLGSTLVATLRYEHAPPPATPVTLHTLLAGVRFVAAHKVVLGAISLDLFAVLFGGATALLPIYARDILHTGPWGLGLLRSAPAVGALSMSVLLARWPVGRRPAPRRVGAGALAGAAPPGAAAAGRDRGLRRGHAGLRAVDALRALDAGAGRHGRRRHGECRHPPDPGAAGDARCHARPRQRGQLGLHRRVQPARRVRVRRHRGGAGAGGLGRARRPGHAGGGGPVAAPVSRTRPARRVAAGRRHRGTGLRIGPRYLRACSRRCSGRCSHR